MTAVQYSGAAEPYVSAEQFAAVGLTLLAVQMVICLPISAANQDANFPCKVIELDVTRKQSLAMRYQVALSDQQPVVCLKLEHGSIVHRLDLSADLRRQL